LEIVIRTTHTLQDDLDGGPADQTLEIGLDGWVYEIDLSAGNAAALRRALAPFIQNARLAARKRLQQPRTVASRRRSARIRAWAKSEGIEVSDRGRIPGHVVSRYEAAVGPD
jgi:hypothetical protein